MISRREKLQLFNKLRGAGHAEADLALLEDVNPRHPKLTRFARDPKRYADEILYALLDECDEGDIVDHRIYFEKLNDTSAGEEQGPVDGPSDTSAEGEQEPKDGSSDASTEEEQIPADGSSDTSAEGEQEPKDGSSDASTEEEQIPDDGSSNTSTEEETPEGENQQESEQSDAADPGEDSKKK
jgi:hypothetical protein